MDGWRDPPDTAAAYQVENESPVPNVGFSAMNGFAQLSDGIPFQLLNREPT